VKVAFENLIPKDHHVSYFIYFDVNPAMIDVNVHPTKTEIKFEEDRSIYSILRSTVRQALGKFNIVPSLDFEQEMGFPYTAPNKNVLIKEPTITVNPNYNPFDPSTFKTSSSVKTSSHSNMKPNREAWEDLYKVVIDDEPNPTRASTLIFESADESEFFEHKSAVMQLQQRYALCPSKTGCFLIDLKRAHIRILYDEMIDHFLHEPMSSQQLLFPAEQELTAAEEQFLEEQRKNIERLGFAWEIINHQLRIFGAPSALPAEKIENYFNEMLNTFLLRDVDVGEIAHEMVLSLAKNAAFQGNRALSQEELNQIVQGLFACKEHSFDPSGNKILKIIDIKEFTHDL
jgi:DNA mismatch repair protein MutL